MTTNIFSEYKTGAIGHGRRVGHSFEQYFSSIDRTSFGFSAADKGPTSKGQVASTLGGGALNAAGSFAGYTGAVGGALGIAGAAVAGAGFLAAIAGPQVAITAGVISLALLVKSTYSNREAAHNELANYVWNMVDDEPPTKGVTFSDEGLNEACGAAMTLMEDGKNQIKLLGSKLSKAQNDLKIMNEKIKAHLDTITKLPKGAAQIQKYREQIVEINKIIQKGVKPDGAIFEYVRRCVHTGNYMQAPHIVAIGMKERFSKGSIVGKAQPDFFGGSGIGADCRKMFTELDAQYKKIGASLK